MNFEFDESLSKIFRAVKAIGAEVTGMAPNKEFAEDISVETYGKESQLGGKADAMRHGRRCRGLFLRLLKQPQAAQAKISQASLRG